MIGYLEGILARTIEGAPSVKPRVTGFFEPPSDRGEASVETEVAPPIAPLNAVEAPDGTDAFPARFASEPLASFSSAPPPRAELEVSRRDGVDLRLEDRRPVEASESVIAPAGPRVPLSSPPEPGAVPVAATPASRPSPQPRPKRAPVEPSFREAPVPSLVQTAPLWPGNVDTSSTPAPLARETSGASGSVAKSPLASSPLSAPLEGPAPATMPQPASPARSAARGSTRSERVAPESIERAPMSMLTRRRPDFARETSERTFESSLARGAPSPNFGDGSNHDSSRGSREAPTLSVTIGRVEVRAVTTPAPAKRPPGPAQRLSLDAYLAGRRERRS
jgi:hypothetical protein